jgi:hypothetical protein
MRYHVLVSTVEDDGGAIVESLPDGCPPEWKLHLGGELAPEFPRGAVLRFSPNHPERRVLQDFVANTIGLLIVSPRARAVLEGEAVGGVEFLPVRIADHRGAIVGPEHAILNPVGSIDAVDMARTRCTLGAVDKSQIFDVDSLALDAAAIPADAKLFRLRNMLRTVVVREDVARALEAAALSGFKVFPADGWDGLTF